MLTKNQIQKRISDISTQLHFQDIYTSTIVGGRIDMLNWCIDRTEEELHNKIERIKEEMLCLKESDLWYQEKKARLQEVKKVLQIL